MSEMRTKLLTDTWIAASWDEYIQTVEAPAYKNARGYYYQGYMRLEMLPIGHARSRDDGTIALAVNLFCITKGIAMDVLPNCSYRKTGIQECQPDVSYYLGDRARIIPQGTSIVDLDRFPPPDLIIEVAVTTLLDDRGNKRALYEELGVSEYWIVNVNQTEIIAYAMADQGSNRIHTSQVLPNLPIATLEAALRRSRETDQSQVGAWLLSQFQKED
jgi:Uma2 family endonuclease